MLGLNTMLVILSFTLLLTPALFSWFGKNEKIRIFKYLAIVLFIEIITLLSVRKVRDYFPGPEITDEKIIGYSQYFQYPVNFDYLFFITLILVPVFTALLIRFLNSKK